MRLVLFRSFLNTRGGPAAGLSQLAAAASSFDGVELSLCQLTPSVVDACERAVLRISCRLSLAADEDADRQLDQLASLLATHRGVEPLLETVIMSSDAAGMDAAAHVARLSAACSCGARFLSEHPLVGSAHGKRNAHGAPLGHHVSGVCHELPGASPLLLAELVETLPPLRLALRAANLGASGEAAQHLEGSRGPPRAAAPAVGLEVAAELEELVSATDHVITTAGDAAPAMAMWQQVWCEQQADAAHEAYATCEAGASGAAAELLALDLRRGFAASAEWRDGARARRDAYLADSARATLAALSKDVAAAARSFGLSVDQAKQGHVVDGRWRSLVKEVHPDVPGGSNERFREMRAHYDVLADDCRRRAPGFVASKLPNARRT